MSNIFWLDLAAYLLASVLSTSLAVAVLALGRKQQLNRMFALFTLAESLSAITSFVLRMQLWLDRGHPNFWLHFYAFTFCLMGPLLLAFAVRYVGHPPTWADRGAALGAALAAVLSVPLFLGGLIFNPRLDHVDLLTYDISSWGYLLSTLPALYYVWSFLLFWRSRQRTDEPYMALSVLILLAGFVGGGVLKPHFPVISFTTTVSVGIIGYGIVRRQLLNPLRELTDQLERKVAERTERLGQANRHLAQQAAELQARNQELDAFAHTVAHDLQSPLARSVGFAEALEQRFQTMSPQQLGYYLRLIAQSSRKMSNIINELLLLASVRQVPEVEVGPLDMASIVSEALQRLTDLSKTHQAEIRLPETWPAALGYAPWVEEVWVNYLSNAIKYGGPSPIVELGATVNQDTVSFWVRDNGPGLTLAEQERVFQPFERFHQLRAQGHGLGLSIVRRIVEKLGGQVGLQSQESQGSTFSFTLPASVPD